MSSKYSILVINPGSTSTKIAVYLDSRQLFSKNISHSYNELSYYAHITDQLHYRKQIIINELQKTGIDIKTMHAVIGRGGLVHPIPSGTYTVNETLKTDLRNGIMGEHASNLGGLIAAELADEIEGCVAFIADPVVVDELDDVVRVSGHPLFKNYSIFHALNQKAVARRYAKEAEKVYESLNLIVAHMGGGISVGAHSKGRVIDVNNGLDGDGPFSPERSGTLPAGQLAKLCYSGHYTYDEVKKMITGKGGVAAHLGTNDMRQVIARIKENDDQARLIFEAMCYQTAKSIGAMAAVLEGKVDAILLTGGVVFSSEVVEYITNKVGFIAPIAIYPGEDEMGALAENALRVLQGEANALEYN